MDSQRFADRYGTTDHASDETGARFQNADFENSLWMEFAEADSVERFCTYWLALQCSMIEKADCALVLLGTPGQGPYSPAAVWPDPQYNVTHLVPAAEQALSERRGVLRQPEGAEEQAAGSHIAYPLEVSGSLHGVVVMEVSERRGEELQSALRQLHWGAAWLEVLLRRKGADQDAAVISRLSTVAELIATTVQPGGFQSAAMALVNDLAVRLRADRVSLGLVRRGSARVVAVSNTARFSRRTNLFQSIEAAMDEALDQRSVIAWPGSEREAVVKRAHEELSRANDISSLITVPLPGKTGYFGAITIERTSGAPLDEDDIELCWGAAQLLGPILENYQMNDRWLVVKAAESARCQAAKLVGSGHLLFKGVTFLVVALVAFFSIAKGDFRVSAKTVIEGEVQRSISAPFDGYLATAPLRAGDVVRKGQLLCTMDDRDLNLEKAKWESEGEQARRKYRESMANHDRPAVRIAAAQINQAEAELALLVEKLSRARIIAPFDGVLVSGDLSQRMGSPVKQGDELFKVAPLDGYRVILKVDEKDIAYVKEGQKGTLILSGLPSEKFPIAVKMLTPVSVAEEGTNYFRVEANLEQNPNRLRPGMEGVGKIESGESRLIWIWTHGVIDWVRLWVWSWWP